MNSFQDVVSMQINKLRNDVPKAASNETSAESEKRGSFSYLRGHCPECLSIEERGEVADGCCGAFHGFKSETGSTVSHPAGGGQ
jgi:hypothetical protein